MMTDCCSNSSNEERKQDNDHQPPFDGRLLIIGGGSAAFAAAIRAHELGSSVTLVNDGLPIGGTCVNVGCVPSKTLIRAAEAHHKAQERRFEGIDSSSQVTDFKSIIAQKDELVGALRQEKYINVVRDLDGIDIVEGRAVFEGPNAVRVNGEIIEANRVLVATGSSPFIPAVPGLDAVDYLTSQTAMELRDLPRSLIFLGGGYIALELGQMFSRLGTNVTILQRSEHVLSSESADVAKALSVHLREEGIQIVSGTTLESIGRSDDGAWVEFTSGGSMQRVTGERILVTTGRRPNTEGLGLDRVGVEVDGTGAIVVDEYLETSAPGMYAAGDVAGEFPFVYAAAYEGGIAAENAITGHTRKTDYRAIPWVVFTDPQLAGVGMDEEAAQKQGLEVDVARLDLGHVPRALAARDTRGFVKLVRDRKTDRLVGARILAPEGGELVMEASLAIKYNIPVSDLAQTFHPYLTMSEAIKLAAITFTKDVSQLSCCAT